MNLFDDVGDFLCCFFILIYSVVVIIVISFCWVTSLDKDKVDDDDEDEDVDEAFFSFWLWLLFVAGNESDEYEEETDDVNEQGDEDLFERVCAWVICIIELKNDGFICESWDRTVMLPWGYFSFSKLCMPISIA